MSGDIFTFVTASYDSRYHAFCKVCRADFSVEHGGKNDISRHANCAKHKNLVEAQRRTPRIKSFLVRGVLEADSASFQM